MNLLVHHLSVSELHRNLSGVELENWVASAKLSKNHEQWTQQEPCSSLRAPPMCTCFPRLHTDGTRIIHPGPRAGRPLLFADILHQVAICDSLPVTMHSIPIWIFV